MKQLKFMLAAATAISLATAAQADTTQFDKSEIDSENFDSVTTLKDTAAVMALKGFSYEGTENDSVVVAGGAKGTANALEVNTGTDPLLRKIDTDTNNAVTLDSTGAKKVYIDTMVQFTVTPYGDTVSSNGVNDKLMIYLKEMTNGVGEVTGTNLMVKAAKYAKVTVPTPKDTFTETDFVINNVQVEPNKWYALEVTTVVDSGLVLFSVSIDGTVLTTATEPAAGKGYDKFPSLTGKTSTTLDQVGFAGEGMVDELAFYHDVEQETSVDFTLDVTGGSAVSVTIGSDTLPFDDSGKVSLPASTTEFTVNYTGDAFAYTLAWSNLTGCSANGATVKLTAGATAASATLALTVATGDDATPPTVPDNATAATVGITSPAFTEAKPEELQKLITWAAKKGVSKTDVNAIPPFEATTGNATNLVQEAYLLDCAPTVTDVDAAKAAFRFPAIVPGQVPAIASDFSHNGTLTIKGATTLGVWKDIVDGKITVDSEQKDPTFFKAFLTK